jgi:hypothetical protein
VLRDLLNKLLAIWHYLKRMFKSLRAVMRLRKFWASQGWQILFLWIIVGFWTSQGYGVLHDSPPPFMWITSALVAISAFAWLTADLFLKAETELERFIQGMLLLQTVFTIIGNLAVIGMEFAVGIRFTLVDWVIVGTDAVGLCYIGWRIRRGGYDWKSPWARRDATTALKAVPQFVTALGILFGLAKQGPLAIGFLLSQCLGRWLPTWKARRAERKGGSTSDKTAAQFATTSIDSASAVAVAACNWVL